MYLSASLRSKLKLIINLLLIILTLGIFQLKKVPEGTELTFTQENVPAKSYAAINKGWKEHYWQPMKEYLKTNKK